MHHQQKPIITHLGGDAVHSQKCPFTPLLGSHRVQLTIHGYVHQTKVEESSRSPRTSTSDTLSAEHFRKSRHFGGPARNQRHLPPRFRLVPPLDDDSKTLARWFFVKKKALRPLHTPGDTCLDLCPQPIRPAAPSNLNILALIEYKWIARIDKRTSAAIKATNGLTTEICVEGTPKSDDYGIYSRCVVYEPFLNMNLFSCVDAPKQLISTYSSSVRQPLLW
jgi:hypothetical protein